MATDAASIIDIEQRLIGAMLLDMHSAPTVAELVEPSDFSLPNNRAIYEAVLRVAAASAPVTLDAVCTELADVRLPDTDAGYLAGCVLQVNGAYLSEYYARKLQSHAIEMRRTEGLERAARLEGEAAMAEVERVLAETKRRQTTTLPWQNQSELWATLHDRLTGPAAADDAAVSTGIPDLNTAIGGMQRGDLIVIAARTRIGKTSMATTIARHVAVTLGQPTVFFSLEMADARIREKLLCLQSRVPWKRLTSHAMSDEEMARYTSAIGVLDEAPITIVTTSKAATDGQAPPERLTVESIRDTAWQVGTHAAKRGQKLGLIVVDYVQLCRTTERTDSTVQEMRVVTRLLKQLPIELDCPLIALSQFNREGARGVPSLEHMKDSGTIEEGAVVVLGLHRPGEALEPVYPVDCHILKNRMGEEGVVTLRYDGPLMEFSSYTRDILGRSA